MQINFLNSCNAVVKNFNDFFKKEDISNMILPLNLIILEEDFIKLINNYPLEKLFNPKCLFIHYRLNTYDQSNILFNIKDYKILLNEINKFENCVNFFIDMDIKKIKRPKNIINFTLSPNEKSEILKDDSDFNLVNN